MGPADLAVRGAGVGREPVADDHRGDRLADQGVQGVGPARAGDAEGGRLGGDCRPEPGPPLALPPAGLVDPGRRRTADVLADLVDRAGDRLGRVPLGLADHPRRGGEPQQIGQDGPHLPLAHPVGAAEQGDGRLEPGAERPARHPGGQRAPRRGPAMPAGQAMEPVLDHVGPDLGQLGDLVADRPGVGALQGPAAAAAVRRLALDDCRQPLGRDQLAGVSPMSALPAPLLPRRRPGRAALDVRRVAGRRPRGVGRVLAEPRLQRGDPPLEGLDQREDRRLRVGRDLVPKLSGDRRLGTHATLVTAHPGSRQPLHP